MSNEKHSGPHAVCVSLTRARNTAQKKALAGQTLGRTSGNAHPSATTAIFTRAEGGFKVPQPRLAMSGDAGWLITLDADGHTGESEPDQEKALSLSLCLSAIFSPFYPTFFHNCLSILVSVDPGVCLAAAPLIYEWLSQTYSLRKVHTLSPFMMFAFSIRFKCLLLKRQTGRQGVSRNISNWILNGPHPPQTTLTCTHH